VVDAFLKTQAHQETTDRLTQEGRKPWTRNEMRMLITQLDQTLLHCWAQFNRRGIAIGGQVAKRRVYVCPGAGGIGCGADRA
jgi:hypothetical protein